MRILIGLFIVLVGLYEAPIASAEDDFCWRQTEGRGVGSIPRNCEPDWENKGLKCYANPKQLSTTALYPNPIDLTRHFTPIPLILMQNEFR